jgi:hypothetical protein
MLTGLPRVVIPGVVCGLVGGLLQAAMPWGTTSWSARTAVKMLALGGATGLVASLLLSHRWFALLEDYPKMGVEALIGFLALQILEWVQRLGPQGIAAWLARRQLPPPPKETPP